MSKNFKTIVNSLLCFLLICSFALIISAQKSKITLPNNDFKNLAGSSEEIPAMRLPNPSTLGTRSKSAMFPINSSENLQEIEIPVDSSENFKLMLLSPNGKSLNLKIALPNEEFSDLRGFSRQIKETETTYGLDGNQFPAEVFTFQSIKSGVLRVQIEKPKDLVSTNETIGFLVASSDSPYRLYSYINTFQTTVGHEIGIVASMFNRKNNDETSQPDSLIGNIRDARVSIHTPNGETIELPMNDSGNGQYQTNFVPQIAGQYTAQVFSKGYTPEGAEFVRSSEHTFEVTDVAAQIGTNLKVSRLDDLRYRIDLLVSGLKRGEKVIAHAEIWGRDDDGNEFPISWLGGISVSEKLGKREVSVPLTMDSRWLVQSSAAKSFTLKNIRLQNPDNSVILGEAESVSLPNIAVSDYAKSFVGVITDEMRQGVRPIKYSTNNAVGGKLMLVHGYCSGDVWASATSAGQFSNYVKFLDLNQNRSHDQFANLIRNFGASLPSYGIVAHSQGGAASLHLYTYYWSGLDSATGGTRLIQSVGTPYQGTALAGNLAILGQIFGAGCGYNNDLTYSGAATWLANIPSWARAKVYFHTTSFTDVWWRYDYCNIATDPFLSDPDDGVVEKAYAQLPGANNLGHKTGWCHTSGMRDPAQTSDSSRNSVMNTNAAR
jgi:hypothetical protein